MLSDKTYKNDGKSSNQRFVLGYGNLLMKICRRIKHDVN